MNRSLGFATFVAALVAIAAPCRSQELVLTGIVDGPLSGGTPKAVELFAKCDIPDLSSFGLGVANNGGGSDGEEFTFPSISVSQGQYLYVASESAGFIDFFGFAPDFTTGTLSINGDDAIELFKDGKAIDLYGSVDVDGTGTPWEYTDGWAYRDDNDGPATTFDLAAWTFSGPDALDGALSNDRADTPVPIGIFSHKCDFFLDCNNNGIPDDLDILQGTSDDCNRDGIPDECQLETDDCNDNGVPDDCDIANGTSEDLNDNGVPDECEQLLDSLLIISEIMQNPAAVADSDGEWFEIYNAGGESVNLNGITFADEGFDSFTIEEDLFIGPGAFFVLGRNGNPDLNGGVDVDYVYGSEMSLSNSDDEIIILDIDRITVIDRVDYDGGPNFPDPNGASMTLDPDALDPVLNDDGAFWCEGQSPFGDGDFGTPGMSNDDCEGFVDCNNNGVPDLEDIASGTSADCNFNNVPDECDIDSGVSDDSNENGIPDECEVKGGGTLIITEIMQNPDVVPDSDGEWFEIFNNTNRPIDLQGMSFQDNGSDSFQIQGTNVVQAGAFFVLARNADSLTNGGVIAHYEYGSQMTLSNNADQIIIIDSDGVTELDRVEYDGGPNFPDPTGASMTLDPIAFDVNLNNIGSNWCEGQFEFGEGDLGTPGMSNDFCGKVLDCNDNGVPDNQDIANGTSEDCNNNNVPDECDITDGTSKDRNGNGIPDECETACPEDFNGDGQVGTKDLLSLLGAWGFCLGCPQDLDDDDNVNTADLLQLLGAWGDCPQ